MHIIGIRKFSCIYQIREVDFFQLKRSYNPFNASQCTMAMFVSWWCHKSDGKRAVHYRLAAPLWCCMTRHHTQQVSGYDISANALKSKAFTSTSFFFYISLMLHVQERFASALVAWAPFCDFP